MTQVILDCTVASDLADETWPDNRDAVPCPDDIWQEEEWQSDLPPALPFAAVEATETDAPLQSGSTGGSTDIVADCLARAAPTIRPPAREDLPPPVAERNLRLPLAIALLTGLAAASFGWDLVFAPDACHSADMQQRAELGRSAVAALADRIVMAESNGNAAAKNELSSATGAGQFLDGTWLDMIRANRPDLDDASEDEILALRRDAKLSRDMVVQFAEQNARILARRCLPITPGTLYLSHFAGGGGAAAVLSSPNRADAAAAMAKGDSRGKLTREMIVAANPFLKSFTVADLKSWADKKMKGRTLRLARK